MSKSGKDDDDEFQSVHAFSSNDIGKSTESKLANDGSTTGGNLDGSIGVSRHGTLFGPVNYAQHSGEQANGEDVVGISEKANTGYNTSSNMVPGEA